MAFVNIYPFFFDTSFYFRFDGQFVTSWLLQQGTTPEVIPNGSKLMSITHPNLNLMIIDSFSFLPMPLSALPSCFGIQELKKGFFPFLFNTRENQFYVGPVPNAEFYRPDEMPIKKKQEFSRWYAEHKDDVFDFQKEMKDYCRYV